MDDRLDEEVAFHVDMQTERNIALGMTPDEAHRQALIRFGGRERWKAETRDQYRPRRFDGVLKDFVLAARSLRRHGAFTTIAVTTLALGIGASTAIFSVVNAVLLRPLPYADADRLALIWGDMRARNVTDFSFSPPIYEELRTQSTSFEDIAALTPFTPSIQIGGEPPEQVRAIGVSPNVLSLLGARILVGRDFTHEDAIVPVPPPPGRTGGPVVPPPPTMVILNHGFWQRRFGGDTSVVGRTIDLGGQSGMIVGVLAPGFEVLFPPSAKVESHPDLLTAQRIDYVNAPRLTAFLRLVGRVKPGVTFTAANEDVERSSAAMRDQNAIMKSADWHFRVEPMHEDLVHDVRPAIFALMGAVLFVLLIACANVANLQLVRAAARERELAVRAAMGSSPWRIVRQLVIESLVLSVGGALLALGLAVGGIRLLVALAPANVPRLDSVAVDLAVLGFATLAAVLAAALFGIVPAIRASKPDLADVLRSSGRAPGLGGGKLLVGGVVVAEVALSFVLLVGAGLMVRSFVTLSRVSPGFDARGVLTFQVGNRAGRSPEETEAFKRRLQEQLSAIPGVQSVTSVFPLPLDGQPFNSRWGKEDAVADPAKFRQANVHAVLPGYFETMGTRVIAGRAFTAADNVPTSRSVIIDDVLAAKAFPGESAVGKRLFIRTVRVPEAEWLDVVGVVEHQRHQDLTSEKREAIFVTDGFFNHGVAAFWAVRMQCATRGPCNPSRVANAARTAVHDLDSRLSVSRMEPLSRLVDRAMTSTRFALVLIAVFATIAAVLACVGLYGVLSTAVRQRTAEIGVRVALGAPRRSVFGLVVGHGMKLSALGLGVGLIAALVLTRSMTTMLVGIQPTDLPTYATIVVLFIAIALVACSLPARRAARMDPLTALRSE